MNLSRRTRHVLAWAGVSLGVLIGAALLALALVDWNAMKGPIERMASARSGRTVKIAGDIDVHPWSWTPSFSISGLTLKASTPSVLPSKGAPSAAASGARRNAGSATRVTRSMPRPRRYFSDSVSRTEIAE